MRAYTRTRQDTLRHGLAHNSQTTTLRRGQAGWLTSTHAHQQTSCCNQRKRQAAVLINYSLLNQQKVASVAVRCRCTERAPLRSGGRRCRAWRAVSPALGVAHIRQLPRAEAADPDQLRAHLGSDPTTRLSDQAVPPHCLTSSCQTLLQSRHRQRIVDLLTKRPLCICPRRESPLRDVRPCARRQTSRSVGCLASLRVAVPVGPAEGLLHGPQ